MPAKPSASKKLLFFVEANANNVCKLNADLSLNNMKVWTIYAYAYVALSHRRTSVILYAIC